MATVIAARYSLALFELGKEENSLEKYKEDLNLFNSCLENNSEYKKILSHPRISNDEKKGMLKEAFGSSMSLNVINFIQILIDKGRISKLNEIYNAFIDLYNQEFGIVNAIAYSAVPLSADKVSELTKTLEKQMDVKIVLDNVVDDTVIGGLRVEIGDTVIDNTIRNKFDNIKNLFK